MRSRPSQVVSSLIPLNPCFDNWVTTLSEYGLARAMLAAVARMALIMVTKLRLFISHPGLARFSKAFVGDLRPTGKGCQWVACSLVPACGKNVAAGVGRSSVVAGVLGVIQLSRAKLGVLGLIDFARAVIRKASLP